MVDRIGQQLGNYLLIGLLRRGGFGEVYLGEHIYKKTPVAIKVPRQFSSQENFLNEARLQARLDHPNIERVLDFSVENSTPYLVTEYASDGTLRNRHPSGSRLTLAQTVTYVKQLASALQYVHDHGLVHRDVKPENLLLGANGRILLSGFGIATLSRPSTSSSSQPVAGTPPYMAPEQWQGRAGPASDQYSLAIVAYEWLMGHLPFQGYFNEMASQHRYAPPPSLRAMNPAIPPGIEEVIMIALSKDPRRRFARMRAFATAFEQAADLGKSAQAPSPASAHMASPIHASRSSSVENLPTVSVENPPNVSIENLPTVHTNMSPSVENLPTVKESSIPAYNSVDGPFGTFQRPPNQR